MTRDEMREIVGQEENQEALAKRDLPTVHELLTKARLLRYNALDSYEQSLGMSDAVANFMCALDVSIADLESAYRLVSGLSDRDGTAGSGSGTG